MNKSTKLKIQIAVFAVASIAQTRMVISLVLASVSAYFPDAKITTIQMLFSSVTLTGLIASLLVGKLAQIVRKKTILIGCNILGLIGGLLGYFGHNSLACLFAASLLIGLGFGVFTPLTGALAAEHFEGDARTRIIGWRAMFMNVGGIVIMMLAGQLAQMSWYSTYLSFLLCAAIALICAFCLPKGEIEKNTNEDGTKIKVFNPWLINILFLVLVEGISYAAYSANLSYYIVELGLGGASQTSYMSSIQMAGSCISGLVLAQTMKVFKKNAIPVSLLGIGISFFLLYFAKDFTLLMLGAFISGFATCVFANGSAAEMPANVPKGGITTAMSFFNAFMSIGMTLSPYIITNSAALINDKVSTRFLLVGIILTVLSVYAFFSLKKLTSGKDA